MQSSSRIPVVAALALATALVLTACSTDAAPDADVATSTEDGPGAPGDGPSRLPGDRPDGPSRPGAGDASDSGDAGGPAPAGQAYEPSPVPDLPTTYEGDAPLYVLLFTHTEDHINHDLSEERYTRMVPVVGDLARRYPDAGIVWNIEFQGADARTIAERNPQTGVADLLRQAESDGYVQFGYHAFHDPTYLNRPQNDLRPDSSWAEQVTALDQWVSCRKDSLLGGCVEEDAGGVVAVQEAFGQVTLVTGVGLGAEVQIEGSAGVHALRRVAPDRVLGFAFPDHGPSETIADYDELLVTLLSRLSPSAETSPTAFWMDNTLRIDGGDPVVGVSTLHPKEGADYVRNQLADLPADRPRIMTAGMADKFTYANTSPTVYAYSHPDAPELPDDQVKPRREIEKTYELTAEGLEYLAAQALPARPGSRFVAADQAYGLVATVDAMTVTAEELDAAARWLLLHWGDVPPDFASDGTNFYSLRETFVLLAQAIATGDVTTAGTQDIPWSYGPLQDKPATAATSVAAADLEPVARDIATAMRPSATWEVTPSTIVASTYDVGGQELTAAQLLYAMAVHHASTTAGEPVGQIAIPATDDLPATYELLVDLGCETCLDSSWSLKPARIPPAG